MSELNTPKGVTRRTIAKGAAWTVPAIAVAGAAPAMAASPPEEPPGEVTLTGKSCKIPGGSANGNWNDGAVYEAVISNSTDAPVEFEITKFIRAGIGEQDGSLVAVVKLSTDPAGACCINLTNVFTIPANSTGTYAFVTRDWGSSGTTTLTVEYEVDGAAQPPATSADGDLKPIPNCNGQGGSCALSNTQKACIQQAVVAGCTTANAVCS